MIDTYQVESSASPPLGQRRIARGPVDQAEGELALAAELFEFLDLRPGAAVEDDELRPVHVQAVEVQPAHVHLGQRASEGLDPAEMVGQRDRRVGLDVADEHFGDSACGPGR